MSDYPYIEFWGAAGTVTGSKYLIHTGEQKILIDCGLFQGEKEVRKLNRKAMPFDPKELDAVILTHAHIDHSGYLPALMKSGFEGPIYCTEATYDLCRILLPDSGYLKEKQAKYANQKGFSKHKPALPLYTLKDAQEVLSLFKRQPFHETLNLGPGLNVKFLRAGHILGAAILSLHVGGRHIVFSGDLGRPYSPTMSAPDNVLDVDYLILESTYGDRVHEKSDPEDALLDIIAPVTAEGGTVLIPCFAVGRTQTLLFHLSKLKDAGHLKNVPVFLDSPMAINASKMFCRHPLDHKFNVETCRDIFGVATYVNEVEESKALNTNSYPKIILSASGMATGGRVLHHLKNYIEDPRNAIVFTGFQAKGTRGEALVNGADHIRVHGRDLRVKAKIQQLDMLSAHADRREILGWLETFNHSPNKTFLTHGEPDSALALKDLISESLHWQVKIPEYGERVSLK